MEGKNNEEIEKLSKQQQKMKNDLESIKTPKNYTYYDIM